MESTAWQKWFEEIWTEREEKHLRGFFGDLGKGIYTLSPQTFASVGIENPDPRFLFHGVFESAPNQRHADWVYVTSGMSNAWGDTPETANPAGYSGLGCEYVLHTSSRQGWAIQLLQWLMAVQLGVATGQIPGELIQHHDRIGIGKAIPTQDGAGEINHLLVCAPDEPGMAPDTVPLSYLPEFVLPTGRVEMLLLIGITAREKDFAKSQGAAGLITLLHHRKIFPRTEPTRKSLL